MDIMHVTPVLKSAYLTLTVMQIEQLKLVSGVGLCSEKCILEVHYNNNNRLTAFVPG